MDSQEKKNPNSKVVWTYNGYTEDVPAMYDKSIQLCRWWIKYHKSDSQYAKGKFTIVPMEP